MHDNDGIYQPENSMRSPINENSYTAIENLFAPGGFAHESALPAIALNADAVVLGLNKTYADIC
ncbi:MAG: hypothetical protein NT023_11245, partial [Armatimonadetes bacterium]|nr:hypothetical protein [Armatimonadota bacterium]